jgi:hypothetical protein
VKTLCGKCEYVISELHDKLTQIIAREREEHRESIKQTKFKLEGRIHDRDAPRTELEAVAHTLARDKDACTQLWESRLSNRKN